MGYWNGTAVCPHMVALKLEAQYVDEGERLAGIAGEQGDKEPGLIKMTLKRLEHHVQNTIGIEVKTPWRGGEGGGNWSRLYAQSQRCKHK